MYLQIRDCVYACHNFRDPITGIAHPRLYELLQNIHLTAEKRVRSIFYWAHVLGTKAEVIDEESMRTPAIVAVSTLQLLLIATRGHRSYTRSELDIIFLQVGHQFFSCLETMAEYVDKQRMAKGAASHASNPNRNRPPVPFKRMRRFVHLDLCFEGIFTIYILYLRFEYKLFCILKSTFVFCVLHLRFESKLLLYFETHICVLHFTLMF